MLSPRKISQKMFISSDFVEHYRYEKPFWVGFPQIRPYKPKRFRKHSLEARLRTDAVTRTKSKIRRLVDSNPQLDKFVMLTFNRPILKLTEANYIFNQFVKRITYQFPDFQYLCVPEFQPISKRVHYHLLCKLPWVDKSLLESIWGNGFVGISFVQERERVGAYIAKYISADLFDPRYFLKRKFLYSSTLKKPLVIYGEDCDHYLLDRNFFAQRTLLYKADFETDYLGLINYERSFFQNIDIKSENKSLD